MFPKEPKSMQTSFVKEYASLSFFLAKKAEIKLHSLVEFGVSIFQQCMMLVYVSMHYFLVALLVALAMSCAILCVCDKLNWHSGNIAS